MSRDQDKNERRPEGDAPDARRTGFAQIWAYAAARIAEARPSPKQVYSNGLVMQEAGAQAHESPNDV